MKEIPRCNPGYNQEHMVLNLFRCSLLRGQTPRLQICPPYTFSKTLSTKDDDTWDVHGTLELYNIWVFPKIWYPQIIHFNRVFHHKPSILGYPYCWKHPYAYIFMYLVSG